jgi:hypothetical protein
MSEIDKMLEYAKELNADVTFCVTKDEKTILSGIVSEAVGMRLICQCRKSAKTLAFPKKRKNRRFLRNEYRFFLVAESATGGYQHEHLLPSVEAVRCTKTEWGFEVQLAS